MTQRPSALSLPRAADQLFSTPIDTDPNQAGDQHGYDPLGNSITDTTAEADRTDTLHNVLIMSCTLAQARHHLGFP